MCSVVAYLGSVSVSLSDEKSVEENTAVFVSDDCLFARSCLTAANQPVRAAEEASERLTGGNRWRPASVSLSDVSESMRRFTPRPDALEAACVSHIRMAASAPTDSFTSPKSSSMSESDSDISPAFILRRTAFPSFSRLAVRGDRISCN